MREKYDSGPIVRPQYIPNPALTEKAEMFPLTQPSYTLKDIILQESQLQSIKEVLSLAQNENLIYRVWGLERVIKRGRGLKVNLYGAPGTGKTMAAHAIANELKLPLLEVSYAEIESKFVGETSKNIVSLFQTAKEKNAVLLFDEADALLSKRVTDMHSSSDVSVNQTRSVLLKLLDEYDGVCLFTTNFIRNFDSAFMRRITRHIFFDLPNEPQRKRLWEHYLVDTLPYVADPQELAEKFALVSGSDIANAVLNAAIHAASCHSSHILQYDFEQAMEALILAKGKNDQEGIQIREVSEEYVKAAMKGEKNI